VCRATHRSELFSPNRQVFINLSVAVLYFLHPWLINLAAQKPSLKQGRSKLFQMGRVRSYKKIKSCDPFSKKKKSVADDVHDEPPDHFDDRVRRDVARKDRLWQDDNSRELMLQREAVRNLKETERQKMSTDRKIEGKKEDESMKEFKTRIRQETRNTLRDELKNMTSTAKKRKERLKERKLKRKGMPGKVTRVDVEEGFSSASDGRLRHSDLGGSDEFAKAEPVKFGERSERPPDLKGLLKFTEKPMRLKVQQQQQPLRVPRSSAGESEDREPAKKKKRVSVTDIADGEDGLGMQQRKVADGIIHAGNGTGKSSATVAEMELLRKRVQGAYKLLQEKRRAAR